MTHESTRTRPLSHLLGRRRALSQLGAALAAIPALKLLGCADETSGEEADSDAGTASPDASSASSNAADAGSAASDAGASSSAASARWSAVGGTAAMIAKSSYPDPFSALTATSCAPICQTTIGPCHTTSPERVDVSDGLDGLPMRISLRIVDDACEPVAGALVEIWHTNYKGIYSGRINTMCNEDEADRAAQYFRGYQITDADGRVDFDSCFPGWYTSRAVHVHVRVLTGSYDAADSASAVVITQLLWEDSLIKSMFSSHPLYATYGQPDTLLAADNVVGSITDKSPYLFDVAQMSDGAMQASKTLVVRADTSTALCSAGGSGGAGPGAPPGA